MSCFHCIFNCVLFIDWSHSVCQPGSCSPKDSPTQMMHNIMEKYQVFNLMWNFFTYFIFLDIVSADKTLFNNWENYKRMLVWLWVHILLPAINVLTFIIHQSKCISHISLKVVIRSQWTTKRWKHQLEIFLLFPVNLWPWQYL